MKNLIAELEIELVKVRGQNRVQSEFLRSRQCSDHSGKWERGRCLQCELEQLKAAIKLHVASQHIFEKRIAELERHIRSTDGSSVRIAELEKENEKLKAYDPYTVDEIFRLKAELKVARDLALV